MTPSTGSSLSQLTNRTTAPAPRHGWAGLGITLEGIGRARLNPADEEVAEIGDELAVARALSNLANQLFSASVSDIEASTHTPVIALHPS